MTSLHIPPTPDHPSRPQTTSWTFLTTWVAGIVLAGIVAGGAALTFTFLLHTIEHLVYGTGELGAAVRRVPPWQRVLVPTLGGGLAGCGWWALRHHGTIFTTSTALDPERAAVGTARGTVRSWLDAALQVVIVGMGGSIGREGAPRQSAATLTAAVFDHLPLLHGRSGASTHAWGAETLDRWTRSPVLPDRRAVLVASAAGAGLAAVYATPLAGAVFALEVTLGLKTVRSAWRAAGPALLISGIAVVVALPVTHDLTTYDRPDTVPTLCDLLVAAAALTLVVPAAWVFRRAMDHARSGGRPVGIRLVLPLSTAGALLGLASCVFPPLVGNGTALVADVLDVPSTATTLLGFALMKPAFTWLYVRSGAQGGLLTPALATGAAIGALVAMVGSAVGTPHSSVVAVLTAASFLAVTQRAPCFAAMFVWELTAMPTLGLPIVLVLAIGAHHLAGKDWRRIRSAAPLPTRGPTNRL